MAYVRRRGNQVAIVHGERDLESGQVDQRILFTLYSKAEVLEALGRGADGRSDRFKRMLEREHPGIRFDWKAIRKGLAENKEFLPDLYEYKTTRVNAGFRKALCAFTRQLIISEPQHLISAARLIEEHRFELEYVEELIRWNLKLRHQEENQWNSDNPFFWRHVLRGSDVPPEAEEHAAGYYERRELDRAEAIFRLLVESFDDYAEGYNYLGLIALEQGRIDEAIEHFRKTSQLGRKLFPKRISKKSYWRDIKTRPYMRGLRNLAIALNRAGRYEDALEICDRLESECADAMTAVAIRASVHLNARRWQSAVDAAASHLEIDPSAGFIAAFGLFELGRRREALERFLHASINYPRASRMLLHVRTTDPSGFEEVQDHNTGVHLSNDLNGFFSRQRPEARRFFRRAVRDARVGALLDGIGATLRRRHQEDGREDREAFDRLRRMRSREFAGEMATKWIDLLGAPEKKAQKRRERRA